MACFLGPYEDKKDVLLYTGEEESHFVPKRALTEAQDGLAARVAFPRQWEKNFVRRESDKWMILRETIWKIQRIRSRNKYNKIINVDLEKEIKKSFWTIPCRLLCRAPCPMYGTA